MSESSTQATQLAAVLGEGVEIVDGIAIVPIRVKQFSGILGCLGKLGGAIDFANVGKTDWAALITTGGDDVIELIAEAVTLEPDPIKRPAAVKTSIVFVGGLDILQAAKLLGKWFQVNKDFFVQNQTAFLEAFGLPTESAEGVIALVREAWASVERAGSDALKKAKAGPTSSSSSSHTDTASTTSANTP